MEHDPANQRTSGSSAQNENYEWIAPQQVRLIKITRMKWPKCPRKYFRAIFAKSLWAINRSSEHKHEHDESKFVGTEIQDRRSKIEIRGSVVPLLWVAESPKPPSDY
uniref:HDC09210 n=1 Tax=Drosophila melanogaster TaxID=7227 RepID=Q6ILK5_DROME|nr:TPA_inf: HDC09210 [Drosophila melanogaster]